VNAIAPGPIETSTLDSLPKEWQDAKRAELPIGRFGRVVRSSTLPEVKIN
jgi:3-oxoacyl-[acyl-carrier protein] reductase